MSFEDIEARGVVKMFGATRALAGVSVRLRAGEVTVLEGANGSGKSTLLGVLGLSIRPTRGSVHFGDRSVTPEGADDRAQVGVLSHAAMLYPDLTGRENLQHFARLHEVTAAEGVIHEVAARFELGAFFDRPTRTYSRGQLQRVALSRALLHRPRLLLLDEPSTGLDAASVERLVRVIAEERGRGAILALVTHDGPFAERVADRRIRLDRGRLVEAA